MNRELIQTAEKYNKKHSRKKTWHRIVGALGCVVVFCTSYALILPAITMSRNTYCGHEEHEHTAACYGAMTVIRSACSPETLGLHVHSAECFDENGNTVCTQADYAIHTHSEICYAEDGTLWCTLAEVSGHVHGDECYATVEITPASDPHAHTEACYTAQQGELTCAEEARAGHAHSTECYTRQQGELTCTEEERAGHAHDETCYTAQQGGLVCQLEEDETHTHADDCYAWETVLSCALAEDGGHAHGDECYAWSDTLTCTLAEDVGHAHSDACYLWEQILSCGLADGEIIPAQTEQQLICTLVEDAPHVHSETCYITEEIPPQTEDPTCGMEAHSHTLICYSDPTADVENRSDWEATLPTELSGEATEEVLSIAMSQLGYR